MFDINPYRAQVPTRFHISMGLYSQQNNFGMFCKSTSDAVMLR